jgi:hypothetical protein
LVQGSGRIAGFSLAILLRNLQAVDTFGELCTVSPSFSAAAKQQATKLQQIIAKLQQQDRQQQSSAASSEQRRPVSALLLQLGRNSAAKPIYDTCHVSETNLRNKAKPGQQQIK